MPSMTESERVPTLDDILARLAELAPLDDAAVKSAPVPETPTIQRGSLLDLDRIIEETEALVPAQVSTAESEASQVVIDLRDRVEADVPAVPAAAAARESATPVLEPLPEPKAPAEPEPSSVEPEAALAEPETVTVEPEAALAEPETVAVEPAPALAEPETVAVEPAPALAEPETETVEPEAAMTEIDLTPVQPVDVSRRESISAPGGRTRPPPSARRRNPFKRLIIWSLLLGLGLLVGALFLLVT